MHSTISSSAKAIVSYVPALHAGYLSFFGRHPETPIFILGRTFIDSYPRLNRDIRALDPQNAAKALTALGFDARVIEITETKQLSTYASVVIPDEDVTRDFAEKHLNTEQVVRENIFLRWDGVFAGKESPVSPDRTISDSEFDRECMDAAKAEGEKSADWWRQIGAVLVKDGAIVALGHTRYFPSDLALDIFGTPRTTVDAGERPDLYVSMHAEADLVAQAAQLGIPLKSASLYVSTFPCINCAFLIARSGIKSVYFDEGYSRIDAEGVLKGAGVEIVQVSKQAQ